MKHLGLSLITLGALCGPLSAHPVPRGNHDRTVVVRLGGDAKAGKGTVTVFYRLEVDELTVVLEDMVPFGDQVDYAKYKGKPDAEQKLVTHLTTNPKIKVDGKEELHDSLKTKNDADIKNVIQYILSR